MSLALWAAERARASPSLLMTAPILESESTTLLKMQVDLQSDAPTRSSRQAMALVLARELFTFTTQQQDKTASPLMLLAMSTFRFLVPAAQPSATTEAKSPIAPQACATKKTYCHLQ